MKHKDSGANIIGVIVCLVGIGVLVWVNLIIGIVISVLGIVLLLVQQILAARNPEKWHPAEYKTCPYCIEPIKREAIRCKHCGADLTYTPAATGVSDRKEFVTQDGTLNGSSDADLTSMPQPSSTPEQYATSAQHTPPVTASTHVKKDKRTLTGRDVKRYALHLKERITGHTGVYKVVGIVVLVMLLLMGGWAVYSNRQHLANDLFPDLKPEVKLGNTQARSVTQRTSKGASNTVIQGLASGKYAIL